MAAPLGASPRREVVSVESTMRLAVLAGLVVLLCSPASAGFIGLTIQVDYYYPNLSTLFDTANAVVGPGVELSGFPTGDPRTNIDLSDTNIYITYNSSSWWNTAGFNGVHFYDLAGAGGGIISVTINPVTNMAGLDASRISFDANNIWVNWQGLGFWGNTGDDDIDTVVSLDITFGDAVPEPATWLTLPAGLLGAAWLARRARRRA